MSKVIFNKEKFWDLFKKGISVGLALGSVGNLAGCSNDNVEIVDTPTTGVYGEPDEDTAGIINDIYDFMFVESTDSNEITQMYDWSNTEQIVKAKNKEAGYLLFTEKDEQTGLSKNKYGVLVCEDEKEFGSYYYSIIDNEGDCLEYKIYGDVFSVDDHTIAYRKTAYDIDGDIQKSAKYTIFDQITGETVDIDAYHIITCNGVIIKSFWRDADNDSNVLYKLLNSDGASVNDVIYDDVCVDYDCNIMYLTKDGVSEAFDVETRKAKKINGEVLEAENGYVVIKSNDPENEGIGIFHLENINDKLVEVIPYEKGEVSLLVNDKENPLFARYDKNNGDYSLDYNVRILNKNGEVVAADKYDYVLDDLYCDLVVGYNKMELNGDSFKSIDVYNTDGEKIVDNIFVDSFSAIPGTELAIIKCPIDDCYNVIDFSGAIKLYPDFKFDQLYINPIYSEQEDGSTKIEGCYLIGRQEDNKTIVYTSDLDEVASGDYGFIEAEEIASKHFIDTKNAKVLSK